MVNAFKYENSPVYFIFDEHLFFLVFAVNTYIKVVDIIVEIRVIMNSPTYTVTSYQKHTAEVVTSTILL